MTEETRTRLIKLLGMLGSEHDGEVVAAARAIEKLRAGVAWNDLIAPAVLGFDPHAWDDLIRRQAAAQQQESAPFSQTWDATHEQVDRVRRAREQEAKNVFNSAYGNMSAENRRKVETAARETGIDTESPFYDTLFRSRA